MDLLTLGGNSLGLGDVKDLNVAIYLSRAVAESIYVSNRESLFNVRFATLTVETYP